MQLIQDKPLRCSGSFLTQNTHYNTQQTQTHCFSFVMQHGGSVCPCWWATTQQQLLLHNVDKIVINIITKSSAHFPWGWARCTSPTQMTSGHSSTHSIALWINKTIHSKMQFQILGHWWIITAETRQRCTKPTVVCLSSLCFWSLTTPEGTSSTQRSVQQVAHCSPAACRSPPVCGCLMLCRRCSLSFHCDKKWQWEWAK